jgi:DNA mismatch repair protein MutS
MAQNDNLDIMPNQDIVQQFQTFMAIYRETFHFEEMAKYTLSGIKNSFFNKGVSPDIDAIQKSIVEANLFFDTLITKLSSMIDPHKKNLVKLESTDKDGYTLYLTNNRAKLLKKAFSEAPTFDYQIDDKTLQFNYNTLDMKHLKQGTKLNSSDIQHYSDTLMALRDKMKRVSQVMYLQLLKTYHDTYGNVLRQIVRFVAKLDVIHSNAKCAVEYSYSRPIIDTENSSGYLDCKELRHPIIERIHTKEEYVPNDIVMGKGLHGMLLFGVNAVGKSSLMKSVGLATIMAQAGMYVPCESMTFSPYRNLYTRISGNDNIFKGQSTFAVEMSELRSILKRSDNKSLILGDELCSGTESVSALAIVAAGVISLAKKNASFIFATHLHALSEMEMLKQLPNVDCFHLKVQYSAENQTLVYDRKLEKGSGNPIYGLEVCKAMDMDQDFIDLANEIRLETMGKQPEIVKTTPSHFNKDIYVDKCENCGKTGEDVHHIKEQNTADIDGKIGHIHKNNQSNLVVLCKECHHNVHHGDLEIDGYKQTNVGMELIAKQSTVKRGAKKKFSSEDVVRILEYKGYPNKKDVINILSEKHNLKIGYATLVKILKGEY